MRKLFFVLQIQLFSACFVNAQQVSLIHSVKYSDYNFSHALAHDNTGNIFIAGYYRSKENEVSRGVYLHKISLNGNLVWRDTAAVASGSSSATGLAVDGDGNAYFSRTGIIRTDNVIFSGHHLIKYNPAKEMQWHVLLPPPFNVALDHSGYVYSASNKIYKYSVSGIPSSTITIPKTGNISIDRSNNFYIVTIDSIQKRTPGGNLLWSHVCMVDSKIALDRAGNCYLSETGSGFISPLTKLDPLGNVLWTADLPCYGANAILCDEDNNVFVVGVYGVGQAVDGTEIRKISGNGNILWTFKLPNSGLLRPNGLIKIDGSLYLSADRSFTYDACIFKIELPDNIPTNDREISGGENDGFTVSPNPSHSVFNVSCKSPTLKALTLTVFDIMGKCVYLKHVNDFNIAASESIDLAQFPKGIYTLDIMGENSKETKKIIIE